jgi:hypothetical protein
MYPTQQSCAPVTEPTLAPPSPCVGGEPCPEVLPARCVVYDGEDVPCLEIVQGERLETVLPKLVNAVCADARLQPVRINATSSVAYTGNGTDSKPLSLDVRLNPATGNLLTLSSAGLMASVTRTELKRLLQLIGTDAELRGIFCALVNDTCAVEAPLLGPVANAGIDQTLVMHQPVNLSGTGSDADGVITGYLWTLVSSPAGAAAVSFTDASAAATAVSALTSEGAYVFRLRVTDNDGLTATDEVTITITPSYSCSAPTGLAVTSVTGDV